MQAISGKQFVHVGDTAVPGAASGLSPSSRMP